MFKDLSNRPKTREIEDLQKIPAYFLEVKRGPWERGCCERRRISGCRLSTPAEIRLLPWLYAGSAGQGLKVPMK